MMVEEAPNDLHVGMCGTDFALCDASLIGSKDPWSAAVESPR